MAIEITFIQEPSKDRISVLNKFANTYWGESIHEGDTTAQFFATPDCLVELFVDNRLVSGLELFFRNMNYGGKTYRFFGIGGVITHPDYRHQGFATKVLMEALNKFHDFDFAMLCTDIPRLGPVYTGVGFVPLGRQYYFTDKNGLKMEELGGMIAPLSSPEAITQILNSQDEIFVGISNF